MKKLTRSSRHLRLLAPALLLSVLGAALVFASQAARAQDAASALNAESDLDFNFAPNVLVSAGTVSALALQADGKVIIGGGFATANGLARNNLARLNADGTPDPAFGNGESGANGQVRALALQADGKVIIGGDFTAVNGVARSRIARLNTDGTLDTAFGEGQTGTNGFVSALALQADGKVIIGGTFNTVNGVARGGVTRLNTDGTLDTAFTGQTDARGSVFALALQADGKVIVGGFFTAVNGVARNNLARLNPDGTPDTAFANGQTGANSTVSALALQPDGKVLLGGGFTFVNEVARVNLARLNADGTLDTAFNGQINTSSSVSALALQADGKIIIGGNFTTVNGVARSGIARLNADGTLDTTFGNANSFGVNAVALQTDGKIVIGGGFATVNGVVRNRIARLNADGTLDTVFGNGLAGANGSVSAVTLQPNGKVIIGGQFTTVNGVTRNSIARLNPDGTLDTAFGDGLAGTNGQVRALALQADGKVLLGGQFTVVNGVARNRIARLNADGTLDTTFGNGQSGANSTVSALALQADGKILLGGFFTTVNGVARIGIARLLGTAPEVTLQFDPATYTVNEGVGTITLTVSRAGLATLPATVEYAAMDGTATQRTRYVATSGTLNFAAGETGKPLTLIVQDNSLVDGTQQFSIALSNPQGATLSGTGRATVIITDNDAPPITTNPLETPQFFVRQQYYDFLARVPDQDGLDYWTGQITQCGTNLTCISQRRWQVSLAFFVELEFQQTGAYVYRLYRAAYGNAQPFPNPMGEADRHPYCLQFGCPFRTEHIPSYQRFVADRARVVGGEQLAATQLALANAFVLRPEFAQRYPTNLTGPQFVDALLANIQAASGVDLTSQRTALIALHGAGGRGAVLYRLADDNIQTNPINNRAYIDAEYNRGFVLTQYFGYLRRDPDQPGLNFWLSTVNRFPLRDLTGQNAMVCAFVTAQEYQERFSLVSPRTNGECPPAP